MTVLIAFLEQELEVNRTGVVVCHGELRTSKTPLINHTLQTTAEECGHRDYVRFFQECHIATALLDDLVELQADREKIIPQAVILAALERDHESVAAFHDYFGIFSAPVARTFSAITEATYSGDNIEDSGEAPFICDMRDNLRQLRKMIDSTRSRDALVAQEKALAKARAAEGLPVTVQPLPADAADEWPLAVPTSAIADPPAAVEVVNSPSDQLQIGDRVVYRPEGVITEIEGYRWAEPVGDLPHIIGYYLSCGIAAPRSAIDRHT